MKFRTNKKGFSLAIEIIVIAILALFVMILVIAFFKGWFIEFRDDLENFPPLEIEPTTYEPISFVPLTMYLGKQNRMTVGFYNIEDADVLDTTILEIRCNGLESVKVEAMGVLIPVGQSNHYQALVSVPAGTLAGQYSCVIQISKTEKTFFMQIK